MEFIIAYYLLSCAIGSGAFLHGGFGAAVATTILWPFLLGDMIVRGAR